jgi:hypothetical protein
MAVIVLAIATAGIVQPITDMTAIMAAVTIGMTTVGTTVGAIIAGVAMAMMAVIGAMAATNRTIDCASEMVCWPRKV